jgi:hypothetical protein
MIQPFFADGTPNANNTWLVLVAMASIGGNVAQVFIAMSTRKRQKVEVYPAEEFVHKKLFEKHIEENNSDFRRLEEQRGTDLRDAALSRKSVYEKIETTRKEVSDKVDATRKDLTDKIEAVPDQVIATLRNFGVIGK